MRQMHVVKALFLGGAVALTSACGGSGPSVPQVQDTLLATYPVGDGSSTRRNSPEQVVNILFQLGYYDRGLAPFSDVVTAFDVTPVVPYTDTLRTYVVRPGDNSELDAFLARLTDGIEDTGLGGGWRFEAGGSTFAGHLESEVLLDRADGLAGPDLAGAEITRVVLDVQRLGSLPAGALDLTSEATVSFYGVLPQAPASP